VTRPAPTADRAELAAGAAEVVLSRGHLLRRRVRGFSMAPWIQDGDEIVLAPADPEALRPGDIVQFRASDGLRVHRILAVRRQAGGVCFLVAGDRSGVPDSPVPAGAIRGRVVAVIRGERPIRLDRRAMLLRARLRASRARLGRRLRSRTRHLAAAHEARVLRGLVRAALCPGEALHTPPLDDRGWAQAAAAGIRGGVGPLLHAAIVSHAEGLTCPEAVRARLRAAYLAATAQAALRERELGRVLTALTNEQIPTLVLKGAALAETAYPDPALRPMSDVDLLVRPADRPRARAVLLGLGYEDESNGPEDFVNAAAGLDIDLHTELLNVTRLPSRRGAWRFDLEAFWARATPGRVAGVAVLVPDPVDHFVYLSQHLLLHHGMDGALRLADLLALGLHLDAAPGWEMVGRRAEEAGAGLAVLLAFGYLRDGFGLPIPEAASAPLTPVWPRPALRLLGRMVLEHRLTEDGKFLFALLALPSWAERAAYLRDIVLPSAEALAGPRESPEGVWRLRFGHAAYASQVLWGMVRRALSV
jgi:hypothetical protein